MMETLTLPLIASTPSPGGKRSEPEAGITSVMIQIARAVEHAHKFGVLHIHNLQESLKTR